MEDFDSLQFRPIKKSREDVRELLSRCDRSVLLQVFFTRWDGVIPAVIPQEMAELYQLDLEDIKTFLMNQQPQDLILKKLMEIMH